MAGRNDTGPSTILSSVYNQPRIVEAYLQSSLSDSNFPLMAIQALKSLSSNTESSVEDDAETVALLAFGKINAGLSLDQKNALQEAIRAISLASTSTQRSSDVQKIDQVILLGYCKLLNSQWISAVVEFDIARKILYHDLRKNSRCSDSNVKVSESRRASYVDALNGLLLVSLLLSETSDVAKYRRWIRHERGTSKTSKDSFVTAG